MAKKKADKRREQEDESSSRKERKSEEKKESALREKKESEEKKEKESTTKEKVCEIFEIEKDGKEEVKKVCDNLEEQVSTKDQKKENVILRNILIGIALFVLALFLGVKFMGYTKQFEYRGLDFDMINEGNVLFYHTSFPVTVGINRLVNYNVFIRNDPRELDLTGFEGNINLKEIAVLNMSGKDFNCDGDGIIAIENMKQILSDAYNTKIIKDANASCDEDNRYLYFNVVSGEVTEIKQSSPGCFEFIVKDCEILKATEKFLVELLVQTKGEE